MTYDDYSKKLEEEINGYNMLSIKKSKDYIIAFLKSKCICLMQTLDKNKEERRGVDDDTRG